MSVAKITGFLYGCLGLIFVPFFLLMGFVGTFAGQKNPPFAGVLGFVLAITMPFAYGVMGFIMGALTAFLYNFLAARVGGVEFEFDIRPSGFVAPYRLVPPATPPVQGGSL
jgi:hypothetical protein